VQLIEMYQANVACIVRVMLKLSGVGLMKYQHYVQNIYVRLYFV